MKSYPPAKRRTSSLSSICSSYGGSAFKSSKLAKPPKYVPDLPDLPDMCQCCPCPDWCDPGMKFIDTHCHLEALDGCPVLPPKGGKWGFGGWWERSRDDSVHVVKHVFDRLPKAVAAVISNCCDPLDFAWYEGLMAAWDANEFQDDRLYWTVGVHPYCAADFEPRLRAEPDLEERMLALAAHPRCVGIGECGLDYCKTYESHEAQRHIAKKICCLAVQLKKTLVLHARDAAYDMLDILRENVPLDWPIHLHGYTGEDRHVKELLSLFRNLCVGFCGAITIENFGASCNDCAPLWLPGCRSCGGKSDWVIRDLDALVNAVPLDRLLLETDAPYMAPCQFGYAVCQPWMLTGVADHVAEKKGVTVAEVIAASNRNAKRLYAIPGF